MTSIIVAIAQNMAIGKNNDLLWHLPADLKHFKQLTSGNTVIMGERTFFSLPVRPLPKRRNIVITHKVDFDREGCEIVPSPQAALEAAAGTEVEKLWVIGGGSVYTALLPKCKRAFVTRVDATAPEADTFFPNLDKLPGWEVEAVSEPVTENGVTYRFVDYVNTKP